MNKLEELNKDLEFRRMCRYSDDWLEGYRTARLEEINVVESALAEQPQVNKEQVRWLLEKHTEHHWSKAATINIAALTKGFNALLSAPSTPAPTKWTCPDCGYDSMPYPPKDYNICPKCMVEFGNDDKASLAAEPAPPFGERFEKGKIPHRSWSKESIERRLQAPAEPAPTSLPAKVYDALTSMEDRPAPAVP